MRVPPGKRLSTSLYLLKWTNFTYPSVVSPISLIRGNNFDLAFSHSEEEIQTVQFSMLMIHRGTFGLWLDNDLYRGRSTACETYNSEVLSSSEDFFCVGVEVWTFA